MLINTPRNYSINHYGYLKSRRIVTHNLRKADFKYYNLATPENLNACETAQKAMNKLICDNPIRSFFYGLYNKIVNNFNFQHSDKNLAKTTRMVETIFNNLEFEYDGVKSHYLDFCKRKVDEKNIQKKDAMVSVLNEQIKSLEKPIRDLIRTRNAFAQQKGFDNYHQFLLKNLYGTSEAEINELIDNYYKKYDVLNNLRKRETIIAKEYNIAPDEISPSLYSESLSKHSSLNDYLKNSKQIVDFTKNLYNSMGFEIDKLENEDKIVFDLGTDDKKINRTYCRNLVPGHSVGICVRADNTLAGIFSLLHELGHGMHYLKMYNWLPKPLKTCDYAVSEGIAYLFESLLYKENILENIAPKSVVDKFKEYKKLDEICKFTLTVIDTQFEKELYKNPELDFEATYKKLEEKYYGKTGINGFCTPQIISNPIYLQNYLRASILSEKIYSSATKNLGTELSVNTKTADFLQKRVFGLGKLINPNILETILKL